jgi:hypothetical protein
VASEFKPQNCFNPFNHASSDSSFAIVASKELNEYGMAGESFLMTMGNFFSKNRHG